MSRLYACIICADAKQNKPALLAIADRFSYLIEMLEDGILFDVSGLERLIGKPAKIAQNIFSELQKQNISGSLAVAETVDTATLLARQNKGLNHTVSSPEPFAQLPLQNLDIENDTLNVLQDLGIRNVQELLNVPQDELLSRYGRKFQDVIDIIKHKGSTQLTPNIKEQRISWSYILDFPVDDFEQLIFLLNHGLDNLFAQVSRYGFSTEQLDISFKLENKTSRAYEIKTSFPTLEKTFWLKLTNLRISLASPESAITSLNVVAHLTKPRPAQRGLYAVSRPEPESLLLTVNKLKKLVGENNVGVPIILNQRQTNAFALDADAMPSGKENINPSLHKPAVAFSYFRPPLRADVSIREKALVFLKTQYFSGRVIETSGVWRSNSKWWDKPWKMQEWDVEIENNGVYRLSKVNNDWFLVGEYD